jgi:hypothetical protein
MNCIHHEALSEYDYDFDYLSPIQSKLDLSFHNTDARFIRIVSDDQTVETMGVIVSLDDGDLMTVGFKPLTSAFDINIMFDTSLQGVQPLEDVIAMYIDGSFVTNADSLQNMPIGQIRRLTSTTNWGMNLKADDEGGTFCKINLYDVLINHSFTNYGIVVEAIPDPTRHRINIDIYKIESSPKMLEIDMDGVTIKKFTVRDSSAKENKLIVYNKANYSQKITYYLHPDGTYGTTNTDRIFPVLQDVESVSVEEGRTFAQAAQSSAASKFGNIKFDNLIEIEVMPEDSLIHPLELKIGEIVQIVHNGIVYDTIVSGIKYGELIDLTFGMIRINATKRLRRLIK